MPAAIESAVAAAERIVGAAHVLTEEAARALRSHDMSFEPGAVAAAVVRPGSAGEVAEVVAAAAAAGVAVVPRGGGMTYTRGYTPPCADSLLLDLSRLDGIREIDADDLYVVVEAGCTWERLWQRLREQGLRTQFAGTSSGRYATVGGTLSTNGVFLGSSRYGSAVGSVLGLEVVLGDGRLLRTGSWGRAAGAAPYFRQHGPDFTGLFLADTGALGVKTAASLRLLPAMPFARQASFAFPDFPAAVEAMREMARLNLGSEIYSFDPKYNAAFVALGYDSLAGVDWSVHLTVDAYDEAGADGGLRLLREIGVRHGRELEATVALALRDDPFGGVRWTLLGPTGDVWLPTHAILPFSRAQEAVRAVEHVLARDAAELARHGITTSYQTVVVGYDWIFELGIYWSDQVGPYRLGKVEPAEAAAFAEIPADPAARAVALRLRREISDLLAGMDGVQLQLGRYYRYPDLLDPFSLAALQGAKALFDPQGILNPGALGLGSAAA